MTVPTTGMARALYNLRTALAASSAFQGFAGVSDEDVPATAADARIHSYDLPKPTTGDEYTLAELQALRPCVVIGNVIEDGGYETRYAATDTFNDQGRQEADFYWSVPDDLADDPQALTEAITEHIGGIIDDLAAQAESGFHINSIRTEGPYRSDGDTVETEGDYMLVRLHIGWGWPE